MESGPNLVRPYDLYQQIRQFWQEGDQQIFMTGYSRGAAIAIMTAAIMNDKRCPMPDGQYAKVQALLLFDAVDRSADLHLTRYIPSNVENCYHAMRSDAAHSRDSFGHCGVAMEDGMYGPGIIRDQALKRLRAESYLHESFPDGPTKVSVAQEKVGKVSGTALRINLVSC